MSGFHDFILDLFPLVWSGVVTGCLYALGALGLVMIFKSSRVVNFSHGNIAGLAAFLIYGFSSGTLLSLSWGSAVVLAIVITVAIAFLSYAIIAPIMGASDLTATITTLGIGLIAQGATLLVFGADIVPLDLPLPRFSASLLGLRITGYDITVLAVAVVTIAALFLVIDYSKLGIAFRAISVNPVAAEICGLNLRSIHLFAWVVSAVLGVIGALLIVPTTFLSSTTVATFMLQAFAAAVVGGFGSLPGALIGGILIGVLMNLFTFYVSPEFTNTFLLVVILLALNIFPNGLFARAGGTRV
ncbi:branched-chain amino acid ABC transporter permease [Neorhizobium sp. LjRoot104]|uniref:branched-chain amino acid ABC transporter permease n=1 Tax=Neorhizobium sp. LjRoot104 TaxID=3342254 RepID=UPI003ED023E7